jgi:NTP pyrophosphatase (non-canonical NTP hydrolase)
MTDETTPVAELRDRVAAFISERGWEQFHSPENLVQAIAIEAGELMEPFLWLTGDEAAALMGDEAGRAAVIDELADVIIYALSLANALDVDVSEAVAEKLERNEHRFPAEAWRGRAREDGIA